MRTGYDDGAMSRLSRRSFCVAPERCRNLLAPFSAQPCDVSHATTTLLRNLRKPLFRRRFRLCLFHLSDFVNAFKLHVQKAPLIITSNYEYDFQWLLWCLKFEHRKFLPSDTKENRRRVPSLGEVPLAAPSQPQSRCCQSRKRCNIP